MTQTKPKVPLRILPSEAALTRRAFAAYFHSADAIVDPPAKTSGVRIHQGRLYVVLENGNSVLAVYRVRYDGILRRLRRWPDAITTSRTTP